MSGGPRGWWRRQGVRTRVVLATGVAVTLALVAATVGLALLFAAGRVQDLDAQTKTSADVLTALLAGGQLPTTLPLPAGSPLLAQVLAHDGTVLAASPSTGRALPLAEPSRPGLVTVEDDAQTGTPLRVRTTRASFEGRPVLVVVAAPLGDVRRALHALQVALLVVVPLLVVLTTGLVRVATGLALRPVERLRAAAAEQATRAGTSGLLPLPPGDDEVARLAATLNGLLASLRGLVARQQAFVADAAHELRSPLSALQVQLEVARAHPGTVVLPALLAELHEDVMRLARLVEDLLALARAEDGAPAATELVDLRDLADGGASVQVRAGRRDLERLVANLVSNAERVALTVRVTSSRHQDEARLDVDDDGPGIPPADRERVFDRWVRLDVARDRDTGGSGLGLALARETARRHGGDLEVLDSDLGGARLRLRLPVAEPPPVAPTGAA